MESVLPFGRHSPDVSSALLERPPEPITFAIELYDVHKTYGSTIALNGLTLTVGSGEIFGLLGPNGAGKSTTIKMVNGLLAPDRGSIRVFGIDPAVSGRHVRSITGYVMQETTFDKHLSATENLRMYAELFGMRRREVARRVREALFWAGLTDAADRPLVTYSGGMRRRFDLAVIKLQQPRLTLLDEPPLGLDVRARRHVWELIRGLKAEGTTVLLTTHYLDEAERLCDRIALIQKGRVVGLDTPESLRRLVLGERHRLEVELDTEHPIWPLDLTLTATQLSAATWCFEGEPRDLFHTAASLYEHLGTAVRSVRYVEPTLEDVFLRLTEQNDAVSLPS